MTRPSGNKAKQQKPSKRKATRKKAAGKKAARTAITASVRAMDTTLPLNPPNHDFRWFQRLCADLVMHLGYTNVHQYGVEGDYQKGIDISADRLTVAIAIEHVGIQCKKVQQFGPEKFRAAADEAKSYRKAAKFILIVSREATQQLRDAVRRRRKWECWDEADVARLVRSLPRAVQETYVRTYWGPAFVESFLGVRRVRTFIDPEEVFKVQDSQRLIRYDFNLVGRSVEIQNVSKFLSAPELRLQIIAGRTGIGKTKLLRESVALAPDVEVLYLASGSTITAEALNELPGQRLVIVADDAEQVNGVERLMGFVASHDGIKLLMSSDLAEAARLRAAAIQNGLSANAIAADILLNELPRTASMELAAEIWPSANPPEKESIAAHAADTPLTTVITATLSAIPPERRAQAINALKDTLVGLHYDLIVGEIGADVPRHTVRAIIGSVAALAPIKLGDRLIRGISEVTNCDETSVRHVLDIFTAHGFYERGRNALSLTPDIVRAVIVFNACRSSTGATTGFAERLYGQFGPDANLLRNLSLPAALPSNHESPLHLIVKSLRADLVSAGHGRRVSMLETLSRLAPLEPDTVISLVREVIESPAESDNSSSVWVERTHADVLNAGARCLEPLLTHFPTYVDSCVRLIWPIALSGSEPALRVLQRPATWELYDRKGIPNTLVSAVEYLLNEDPNLETYYSPLDVLAPALKRTGDAHYATSTGVVYQPFTLRISSVAEFRARIIGLFIGAMEGADDRRAIRAIKALPTLMTVPGVNLSSEELAAIDNERRMVLESLGRVISAGHPLRHLQVVESFVYHTVRNDFVGATLSKMLSRISIGDEHAIFRALVPDLNRSVSPADPNMLQALNQQVTSALDLAKKRLIAHGARPADALSFVKRYMARAESAGLRADPAQIFTQLAYTNEDLAIALLDYSIGTGDTSMASAMPGVFARAWQTNSAMGESISRRAIGLKDYRVKIAVLNGLNHEVDTEKPPRNYDPALRLAVYVDLTQDDDQRVRDAAGVIGPMILQRSGEDPTYFILSASSQDSALIDNLLSNYYDKESLVRNFAEPTRAQMLEKLVEVASIQYWGLYFLSVVAEDEPSRAIEILVRRCTMGRSPQYQALPLPIDERLGRTLKEKGAIQSALDSVIVANSGPKPYYATDLSELFQYLYQFDEHYARESLHRLVEKGTKADLYIAALFSSAVPLEVLLDDALLLIAAVEKAYQLDKQAGDRVAGLLAQAVEGRFRSHLVTELDPDDVLIRDAIGKHLSRAAQGSRVSEFLRDLQVRAQENIDRQKRRIEMTGADDRDDDDEDDED